MSNLPPALVLRARHLTSVALPFVHNLNRLGVPKYELGGDSLGSGIAVEEKPSEPLMYVYDRTA